MDQVSWQLLKGELSGNFWVITDSDSLGTMPSLEQSLNV